MTLLELILQEYPKATTDGTSSDYTPENTIASVLNAQTEAAVIDRLSIDEINKHLNDTPALREKLDDAVEDGVSKKARTLDNMLKAESGGSVDGGKWQAFVDDLPLIAGEKSGLSDLANTTVSKAQAAGFRHVTHLQVSEALREGGR